MNDSKKYFICQGRVTHHGSEITEIDKNSNSSTSLLSYYVMYEILPKPSVPPNYASSLCNYVTPQWSTV